MAIHRPDDIGATLDPALFRDELQRCAFQALMTADDLHDAIDGAPDEVRELLVRLTVEEPVAEPDEVVVQLVRDVARRELSLVAVEARSNPEAVAVATEMAARVQELDDPATSVEAMDRLLAWLVVRSQMSGAGQES